METNKFKKELKQWQYDLFGVGVSLIILFLLYIDYNNQILRDHFGSTNDKTMNLIMRLLDKKGGKHYVFGFFICVTVFFGISALLRYQREKKRK